MTVRVHAPHGPLATCALQRAIANVFHSRWAPHLVLRLSVTCAHEGEQSGPHSLHNE